MKIVLFIILILGSCKRELSCEGCQEKPVADTMYNSIVTSYDIYLPEPGAVRAIYPQVRTKLRPGQFDIIETIRVDTSRHYKGEIDLANYYDMSYFYKGDTIVARYAIRYRYLPEEFVQYDTLIR